MVKMKSDNIFGGSALGIAFGISMLSILMLAGAAGAADVFITKVGQFDTFGIPYDVAVAGNYSYVADGFNGLVIVDVSNPAAPVLKGSYPYPIANYSRGVAVAGNYAYLAVDYNGLVIVNVSDPAKPVFKGYYDTSGIAAGVAVAGNYAYVADGNNGLVILDVSDPAAPVLKGYYDTPGTAVGIAVAGNYAYVADYNGLVIVDVSNPTAPVLKGSYDTSSMAAGVAVSGNYAYVADGFDGLVILDVSDPAAPVLKGSCCRFGYSNDIAVAGNYAYIADNTYGLIIADVSNPAVPAPRASYDTPGISKGLTIAGRYAYMADDTLIILNIEIANAPAITAFDPASPVTDVEGANRTFSVTLNQTANVIWYINGKEVFSEIGVTKSTYANASPSAGTWNVTASVQNDNGTASNEWIWIVAAPEVSVSISTDRTTYSPGDTMTVTLIIDNPTSDTVALEWYIGVPQSNKWVTKAKASIHAGYSMTNTIPLVVGNWGPSPLGLVHYVHILDPTTKEVLAQDAAVFEYSPIAANAPQVDIAEELMKQRVKLAN